MESEHEFCSHKILALIWGSLVFPVRASSLPLSSDLRNGASIAPLLKEPGSLPFESRLRRTPAVCSLHKQRFCLVLFLLRTRAQRILHDHAWCWNTAGLNSGWILGREGIGRFLCSGPTRALTPNFWLPPGPQHCFKRLTGTDNVHPGVRPTKNAFVLHKMDILQVDTVFRALPHKWNNQLLLNETECTYIPDSFYCRNS